MVHVETVDLSERGVVLPSDRVGMVIAQPFLSLTNAEPFSSTEATKPRQLQMIRDTLAVALACHHGVPKTHFTIFPEYSIPGLAGIAQVESILRTADWPPGTIVIGGIDAISTPDLATLINEPNTHMDTTRHSLADIGNEQWINCAFTWVKAADESVERWIQPKLRPAGPEQDVQFQTMFRGDSVFAFRGSFANDAPYHFCSLICFDWIATLDGQKAWQRVLDALGQQAAPNELSLSWFFVIQSNDKPFHLTFITETSSFFEQNTVPRVRRDRTCLVFANTAGKEVPGRADKFGNTRLIFSEQAQFRVPKCHPTFASGGHRFRSEALRLPNKEVLFREGGACIHSFAQVNAGSLAAGAAGRTIAVENAFVFPLSAAHDPRSPEDQVPACIKWLNDELDDLSLKRLGATYYPTAPLAAQADIAHVV